MPRRDPLLLPVQEDPLHRVVVHHEDRRLLPLLRLPHLLPGVNTIKLLSFLTDAPGIACP